MYLKSDNNIHVAVYDSICQEHFPTVLRTHLIENQYDNNMGTHQCSDDKIFPSRNKIAYLCVEQYSLTGGNYAPVGDI